MFRFACNDIAVAPTIRYQALTSSALFSKSTLGLLTHVGDPPHIRYDLLY